MELGKARWPLYLASTFFVVVPLPVSIPELKVNIIS